MAGSGTAHMRTAEPRVLSASDLVVEFPAGRGQKVHAVSGLNLDLLAGETVGILGESGCGKSSAGRAMMQLPAPTSGSVRFGDVELTALPARALRRARAKMQMIMQDPVSSLNPRRKVVDLVGEGLAIWGHGGTDRQVDIERALEAVGLDPQVVWQRRPHELSGGQCQRVCIARALMLDPDVLICDEPVSSLDVSVQAQILNLLEDAKQRYRLSMLFIAHDVAAVKNISDRVMVLYLGKTCEVLPSTDMHTRAAHPYTRLLLASIPDATVEMPGTMDPPMPGELPSPLAPPAGCRFRTRCPLATEHCAQAEPELREIGDGHYLACHNVRADA